jgi:GT2 family glycosyltransferase
VKSFVWKLDYDTAKRRGRLGLDIKNLVKGVLIGKENKNYQKRLAGKQMSYREWYLQKEQEWGALFATDAAFEENAFTIFLAQEGRLAPYAMAAIAECFAKNPSAQLLYGDEDHGDKAPWFKPAWSPDTLDEGFYFGSLLAVRTAALHEKHPEIQGPIVRVTDFNAYERMVHELVSDNCVRNKGEIVHLPYILFHGEEDGQSLFLKKTPFLMEKQEMRKAKWRALLGEADHAGEPLLSIVIPSKDQPEVLRKCLESIRAYGSECGGYPLAKETIVVDNGSNEENQEKLHAMAQEFSVQYHYEPMPFHFSVMCNIGASLAKGRLLLFLNDDVTLATPTSLEEMAMRATCPETGAVGLKLLYPESGRIQHAGIMSLPGGPMHKLQHLPDTKPYYGHANLCARNVLAVTAACLMVEKKKFLEAGGFSEALRVAFNDVELCLALHMRGYHNVCVNSEFAYHHESLSRGADHAPGKKQRLREEYEILCERYPDLVQKDPYYSPYLNQEGHHGCIYPAYVTANNQTQHITALKMAPLPANTREDACLMLAIERQEGLHLSGFGVVLGDDNACYTKSLCLALEHGDELQQDELYRIALQNQYRPDLEENLSDQTHVALSGFDVEVEADALRSGVYRVGLLAQNRINATAIVSWSGAKLEI